MDVLVLNKDGEPLSMLPLSVISWQDAIKLVYQDKVTVLNKYENWKVNSPSRSYEVPSVLITNEYIKWNRIVKYNRSNVFLRDDYTCQFCGSRPAIHKLTIDHVLPRSRGGKTVWTNVSTSCSRCNFDKGNDETIQPVKKPHRPTYYELVAKRQQFPLQIRDEAWLHYITWPSDKITLVKPKSDMEINDYGSQEKEITRRIQATGKRKK